MPAKRDLEFRVKISRAEKQVVQAIVKDLKNIREAASAAASALNAIGKSNVDVKKLQSISDAISKIATSTQSLKPVQAANIGRIAKALQEFKALNSKSVLALKGLTDQINRLTKAASTAQIQVLSQQLDILNKSLVNLNKNSKSIGNVKNLLENISKVRFKTTANGIQALSNSVVDLSRRFIRNRETIQEAVQILRSFSLAAKQAFRTQNLDVFEQKILNINKALDAAVKKMGNVHVAATTGVVVTGKQPTNTPTQATPNQQVSNATETQLKKDAAALESVIKGMGKLRQAALRAREEATRSEEIGKGFATAANRLRQLETNFDNLKNKATQASESLRTNAEVAARAGINIGELATRYVTVGKATQEAVKGTAEMATRLDGLRKAMQQPITFSQMLSQGFDRIVASQLKFFAASILLYRGLQAIREEFSKLLEISDRTAKAFAVSRSNVILLEDRYTALQDAIVQTTARTGRSIGDVSEILFQFGSAGRSAEESFAALDSTLNLIIATDADVTLTTKTLAAVYRLLGSTLQDVGNQQAQFARISDVVAAAYRDNQVEINELTQGYKFAIPVAKQLGLSLEEVTGILSTLQNNMIRSGEAGRSLRAIFSRISSQSKQFAAAFDVAIDPSKPLNFLDIIRQISVRMQEGSVTAEGVGKVFTRLGLRGANSFLVLTQQFEDLTKTIDKLKYSSAGAAETMATIRLEDALNQVKIFGENVSRLARTALIPLGAVLLEVVRALNSFADSIRGTYVEKFIGALAALTGIFVTAKIASVAYMLVVGALAALQNKVTVASAERAAVMQLEFNLLEKNTAATLENAAATSLLARSKKALAGATAAASRGIAGLSVILAKFLVIALVVIAVLGAIAYAYYRIKNANEIALKENDKELAKMREQVRERQNQIDAMDDTIKKFDELAKAQRAGRATSEDVAKAMSRVSEEHSQFAHAALAASGDAQKFIDILKEEKDIQQEALNVLNAARQETFSNSVQRIGEEVGKLNSKFKEFRAEAEKPVEIKTRQVRGPLGAAGIEYYKTGKSAEEQKAFLAETGKEAAKLSQTLSDLISKNGDLTTKELENIKAIYTRLQAMKSFKGEATAVGDALDILRKQARGIADIEFNKTINGLTRMSDVATSGLETLRDYALFEFKITVPEAQLKDTQTKIQTALNKINQIQLFVDNEAFRGNLNVLQKEIAQLGDYPIKLSVDEKQLQEQASYAANSFSQALTSAAGKGNINTIFQVSSDEILTLHRESKNLLQLESKYGKENVINTKEYQSGLSRINTIRDKLVGRVKDTYKESLKETASYDTQIVALAKQNRAVNDLNNKFKNMVELQNLIIEAQLKGSIAAEEFNFINAITSELLNQRGTINEDQLDVQRYQNEVTAQQNKLLAEAHQTALDELRTEQERLQISYSAEVITEKTVKTTEELAAGVERAAKGKLAELKILESLNLEYAKSKNAIDLQRDGIGASSGQLFYQLDLLKKTYAIQVATLRAIEATSPGARAANRLELAAKYNTFKAEELALQLKITEEIRKTAQALRDSQQALDVFKAGDSALLRTQYQIRNLMEEESVLNAKLFTQLYNRSKLESEVTDNLEKIARDRNRIVEIEKSGNNHSKKARSEIRRLEKDINNHLNTNIKLQGKIAATNEEIKVTQTEQNQNALKTLQLEKEQIDAVHEYQQNIYDISSGYEDIKGRLYDVLEASHSQEAIDSRLKKLSLEFNKVTTERLNILDNIRQVNEGNTEGIALSLEQQKKLLQATLDYADVVTKIVEEHKKIAEDILANESGASERLTSVYERQLGIVNTISQRINDTLGQELSFQFNERPFTEMIGAANLLGMSLYDIEKVGTEETMRRLFQGFADGSISADRFTGKMYEAVSALRQLNEQQQRLIEAQNKLQAARYELSIQKFSNAFAAGDFDKALQALNEMESASEVIDKVTGEVDFGKTLGRLETAAYAGEELANAIAKTKEENKDSFTVYERAQDILDEVNKLSKETFENIGKTSFTTEFLKQLEVIEQRFKTISGIADKITATTPGNITSLFGEVTIENPAEGHQQGGLIGGTGRGDVVPAMLEPGEYVIPRNVVEKLGVDFFEKLRAQRTQANFKDVVKDKNNKFNAIFGEGTKIPAFEAQMTDRSGFVYGQRTGDIVAASLQEGDFVVPKNAVNFFGRDFFGKLRDPEIVNELVQSNRDRLIDNVSYTDFVNQREDLFEEQARTNMAQKFSHGGLVGSYSGGGVVGYQDGGTAEINRGILTAQIPGIHDVASLLISIQQILSRIESSINRLIEIIITGLSQIAASISNSKIDVEGKIQVDQLADSSKDAKEFSDAMKDASNATKEVAQYTQAIVVETANVAAEEIGVLPNSEEALRLSKETYKTKQQISKQQYEAVVFAELLRQKTSENTEESVNFASAMQKLWEGMRGQGKSALNIIVGLWDKFQQQVHNANSGVKQLVGTISQGFGGIVKRVLKTIVDGFTKLYKDIIPNLTSSFLNNILINNAKVEANYRDTLNDITDNFNNQRADLVESLKRNEISYFDYFNRLEDLQNDSAKERADAEMEKADAIRDNINQVWRDLAKGFADFVTEATQGFSDFFDDVVRGATDMLTKLSPVFETVGAAVGTVIEGIITATSGAGAGGLVGVIGGALGATAGSVAPGVGTAIGAGAGLAIGSIVGGAVGSIFESIVPIAGEILIAFEDMLTSMVQGAAQLVPILVDLATLPQEDFAALFGGFYEVSTYNPDTQAWETTVEEISNAESTLSQLPMYITETADTLIERLGVIADKLPAAIPGIINAFTTKLPAIATALIDTLKAIMPAIAQAFLTAFVTMATQIPALFIGVIKALSNQIQTFFTGALDATQVSQITGVSMDEANARVQEGTVTMANILIDTIITAIKESGSAIRSVAVNLITPIAEIFKTEFPGIIADIVPVIADTIVLTLPKLTDAFVTLIDAFVTVIKDPNVQAVIANAVVAIFGAILNAIDSIFPQIKVFIAILLTLVGLFAGFTIISALIPVLVSMTAIIPVAIFAIVNLTLAIGILIPLLVATSILFKVFGEVFAALTQKLGESKRLQDVIARFQGALDKLGKAIGKLFGAFSSDKVKPDAIDAIADALIFLIEVVSLLLEPIILLVNIASTLTDGLTNFINQLKAMSEILEEATGVTELLSEAGKALSIVISDIEYYLWGGSLIPAMEALRDIIVILTTTISGIFTTAWNSMLLMFQNFATFLSGNFSTTFNAVSTGFKALGSFLDEKFIDAWKVLDDVMKSAYKPIEELGNFIKDTLISAFEGLKNILTDVGNTISDIIEAAGGQVTEVKNEAEKRSNDAGKKLSQGDFVGAFGSATGLFHSGGLFSIGTDPNTAVFNQMIGLQGNEGLAILLEGEGILTKKAVDYVGGEKGIDDINKGKNPFADKAAQEASFKVTEIGTAATVPEFLTQFLMGAFHSGGLFSIGTDPATAEFNRMIGLRANEGLAILMDGEGILTKRGVDFVGGERGVKDINQGKIPQNMSGNFPMISGYANTFSPFAAQIADIGNMNATAQQITPAIDQVNNTMFTNQEPNYDNLGINGFDNIAPIPENGNTTRPTGDVNVTNNREVVVNVTVDQSGSNFTNEEFATQLEEQIATNIANQQGPVYTQANNLAEDATDVGPSGIAGIR